MATKIFHGVPGSYKSSTAMWFEVLPALRSGRVVITNLQGILELEQMQRALGEVFPDSARLFRISISSETGILLIRNFYQWAPIGCLLFIDEIQDVYPNDSSFKALNYNYQGEGFFDDKLPLELVELYHQEQRKIKNNVNVDDYLDDLGESLFDERDYLRYPRTLREMFMRHRHYNWDIILATPDIKEVTPFVRSVCEKAYQHTSKDQIPLPYFKRRPLVLEHNAKESGLTAKKGQVTTSKKVPIDVFKLYKSTATGKTTKSGLGSSGISWRIYCGLFAIVAYFIYMVFFFFDSSSDAVDLENRQAAAVQIPVGAKNTENDQKAISEINNVNGKDNVEINNFHFRDSSVSIIIAPNNFVNLPYGAKEIYISAINKVFTSASKSIFFRDYLFNAKNDTHTFSLSSEQLLNMGYQLFYKNDCLIELRNNEYSHYIYCEPTYYESLPQESEQIEPYIKSAVNL
ncbi:MAG: zonular occludens toxin [Colwellia sp.]|nr:MAG: zonular occludens toxin [Colwellia sp.]